MDGRRAPLAGCLLTVGMATAQNAGGGERPLPQWLTGLIAVACFLFLCFVALLVKKSWCDGSRGATASGADADFTAVNGRTSARRLDAARNKAENIYDTVLMESVQVKVTAM